MIDNVVAALGLGLNLTDEEIADVLWLAVQMQQFGDGIISEQGGRNETLENSVSDHKSPKPSSQSVTNEDRDLRDKHKKDEQNFEVHSKNAQGDDRSTRRSDELPLKIPDARSLQEPLELARSLRPLMRRVPSQVNTLLDEEATVRRIAEEKIWCPVLRPALEPWLDLALVIDESASMLMWKHTIAELHHFLSSYGVFRDVRIWTLGTDKAGNVCIRNGVATSDRNSSPRSPSELIEPNGRGLVLVVSDCIAPIWRNGAIVPALQIWSRSGMVAILQMLPDWLWARTALGRGVAAQFSALAAGIPNYQLTTTTVSTWYDIDLANSIKIPVVTLEPDKFTAWAEMLAGKGGAWSPGIVFEPELFSVLEASIAMDGANELSAADRVQSFRLTASPIARRLAGLLAAAPIISLPIVRILQVKVLDKAQPVHVAEVFLGSLLRSLSEITAKTNPNHLQYDFIEGVRDLLLDSVPSSEIVNVVAEVSEFIAERLGVSLEEFAAVIRTPQQVQKVELVSQTRPFALLTAQILKRLGGEYIRFADEVEQANANPMQKPTDQASKYTYQVGGSLPDDAPSYIERQCDPDLYSLLKKGKYCYVFSARQTGKSSLRVRVTDKLRQEGIICAVLDPITLGSNLTERQWYVSIIYTLAIDLILKENFDLDSWLKDRESVLPVNIFTEFIETIVLQEIEAPIVIFIEEIDYILRLDFGVDTFFHLIISFFEYRTRKPDFNRITFSLLGVLLPLDLFEHLKISDFNKVFSEIEVEGFTLDEAMPLGQSLANKVDNPRAYLEAVIHWTNGQPFLVQKLLALISNELQTTDTPPESPKVWINELVHQQVIYKWESQDVPNHLMTILNRMLKSEEMLTERLLRCYQEILVNEEINDDRSEESLRLQLTGLVVSRNGKLRVYNPIYAAVFNDQWVKQQLANLSPLSLNEENIPSIDYGTQSQISQELSSSSQPEPLSEKSPKSESIRDMMGGLFNEISQRFSPLPKTRNSSKNSQGIKSFSNTICLIGPRGSGKTTYLAALLANPNSKDDSPVQDVYSINHESVRLVEIAQHILIQRNQIAPTSFFSIDEIPLYGFSITIKENIFRSIQLEVACRDFPGELFDNFTTIDPKMQDEYVRECSYSDSILFLIDGTVIKDREYAIQISHFIKYLNNYGWRGKFALGITKCDNPMIYVHRKNIKEFIKMSFPKLYTAIQLERPEVVVEYFALSAFGMIESPSPSPNVMHSNNSSEVIKEPRVWKPFGLVAPIYWLCTGKKNSKLEL